MSIGKKLESLHILATIKRQKSKN